MWSWRIFCSCLIVICMHLRVEMAMKESVEMDNTLSNGLAYGGILNNLVSLPADDTDIEAVAKFAADYALKRHPQSMPLNEQSEITPWQILEPKKLKLHFTQDGKNLFIYEEVSQGPGGLQVQNRQAILGITYTFTLSWPSQPESYNHRFTINKDREKQLHVYSHTFSKRTSASDSKENCIDQSESCSSEAAKTLDQSEGKVTLDSQSECKDGSSHNVWTETQGEKAEVGSNRLETDEIIGRFTTYNIWNFNGKSKGEFDKKFYPPREAHMGKLLVGSNSDIIGLQEVRYDYQYSSLCGPAQVSHFADHLKGYQFIYQPANTFWRGHLGRSEEGLALFSKYHILSHDYIMLSRNTSDEEDSHQRICLHAEIDHPALGVVHVFVSHLSLSAVARERSVVEIWRYMQRFPGQAILLGDLNSEPHEAPMKFLRGEIELLGHRTEGLVDAWKVFHSEPRPNVPGTYKGDEPRDLGLTYNSLEEHMSKRIDFVYVRLTDDFKLLEASLVDDGVRGDKAASDHIGVAAVIAPISQSSGKR
ncbi:uncharacterized protein LOC100894137 [Strongylocentrotus purpuratus]|uniref:Endonuclease/exonuclease/phosphatase domain-containing protein n=1 Tax=Strongylocentrotus purpuratus TaxID=7668 RepID=A0A7M7GGF1_STRPU|nr:uncharacterized protein LOC100894137 [Strongylocentrotus purpuratus]